MSDAPPTATRSRSKPGGTAAETEGTLPFRRARKPPWLKVPAPGGPNYRRLKATIDGLTGIWVGDRKVGSIGVHVSRGVTTHGLAINVNNDLQPFEWVVPCGIEGCRVTSLGRELGAEQDLAGFAATLAARYGEVFDREPVEAEIGRLELDPGTLAR